LRLSVKNGKKKRFSTHRRNVKMAVKVAINGFGRIGRLALRQILKTRERLNKILAKQTGQKLSRIEKDTDRDNFMSAEEAKAYGLVDDVLIKR